MSARKEFATLIKPLVPRTWQIIATDSTPDHIKKTAVVISQRRIEPASNLIGSHLVTFRVFVIDPHTDTSAAEDALDDSVETLLFALDKIDPIIWTAAEKVIYEDYRAYELTIQFFTERKE